MNDLTTSAAVLARFDKLCRAVPRARGRGLSLEDLGACHALARELESATADREKVETMARALGLEVSALTAVATATATGGQR